MALDDTKNNVFPLIQTWADGRKVLWPNHEWNDDNPKPDKDEVWLEVIVDNTSASQPCLGRDTGQTWERDEGLLTIIMYHPLGVALAAPETLTGTALAEQLKRAVQQQQIDHTSVGTGSVVEAGRDPDLPFWRYNIFVPFRTDSLTGV